MIYLASCKLRYLYRTNAVCAAFCHLWWFFLLLSLLLFLYQNGMNKKEEHLDQLKKNYLELSFEKKIALKEQKKLHKILNSQCDPAYIELALKKRLGVVPEGQTKVYFTN